MDNYEILKEINDYFLNVMKFDIAIFPNFNAKNINFIELQYFASSLKQNASHVQFFFLKMKSYIICIKSSCCMLLTFKIINQYF